MSAVKIALLLLSAVSLVNTFGVFYDYHLQCDENAVNPASTTCTFSEAKGDQNTMWHYEPQPDTRWTYKMRPNTIWRVIFANCHFPEIPKGLFDYFVNVKTVIAKQGGIIGIFGYTFKKAYHLSRLELPYNNITMLGDKIFSDCSVLMYLDLSSNQIEKVSEHAFDGLVKLKTLDLQWNKIKMLHSSVFITIINIEVIMLNNNLLLGISNQQFLQNKKLSHLDLSHNHITEVDGQEFGHLNNLTILNLSNNKLREFSTKHFVVKKLYLSRNVLEVVYIFHDIDELYLNDNHLKELQFVSISNVNHLYLQNNSLSDITMISTVTSLKTLKGLDLSHNPVGPSFTTNTFNIMTNLESLELGYCGLKRLPTNIFANLKKLKLLDVTGNHLGYFDTTLLAHMPTIEGLYLEGNDLEEFNFNAIKHKFNNFSELGLSNNNFDCGYLRQLLAEVKKYHIKLYFSEPVTDGTHVDHIRCLDAPTNAKLIQCDKNELANKKCLFKNVRGELKEYYRYEIINIVVTEIEYITFVQSQIKEIPKNIFRTFTYVKYFYATESYIEEIYEYTFAGATYLTIIDLSGNKIKKLRSQIFIECSYLIELNLVNNDIDYIDQYAFEGLSQLSKLYLSGNKITSLNPQTFYYIIEITYIELDGNQIDVLDENLFENNRQLREVNLSKNKLKRIPKYIFKSVTTEVTLYIEYNYIETLVEEIPNVKKMYLTGNEIEEIRIPRDVEKLNLANSNLKTIIVTEETIITELILRNNSLQDISNLGKLKKLEILDLSENNIKYLQPEIFRELKKLKSLRLHKCQITTIETIIFTYLTELQVLDLSGNKLTNFDLQQLSPLTHLESLNLEFCGLSKLNVPVIQNQFPELKEIAIAGNDWDCTYLRDLVAELKKRNIKRYVTEPVTSGPNVEGIGCIEGSGHQMPVDVEYIHKGDVQKPMPDKYISTPGKSPMETQGFYPGSNQITSANAQASSTSFGGGSNTNAFANSYTFYQKPFNPYQGMNLVPGQGYLPPDMTHQPQVPPTGDLHSNTPINTGEPRTPHSGPDVPPPHIQPGESCCLNQGGQIPNCCEEIVEIRSKVKQLEEEIRELREGTKQEVTKMLDAKSVQIANDLKAMVKKLIEEQNTADVAHLHSRFFD